MTINELFAGVGAFRKALINLNVPHKVVGISEIDKFAIKSYELLYGKVRNYGDIQKVEKLDYADIWTYGFPCQDISSVGKGAGIIKGETRSGLLYEVERLLEKAKEDGTLPKYLILENVKHLISKKFIDDFNGWLNILENLGYKNYYKVLNAVDYGIPQNRPRVFVVSVRDDINLDYEFEEPKFLDKKLIDFLEDSVDEKYYLTKHMYEYFKNRKIFRFRLTDKNGIARCITTQEGSRSISTFIKDDK